MIYDYHTHTIFSHGKGTIEQNVQEAIQQNLKAIAITDHGFGQPFAGITPKKFEVMKAQVKELRKKYPQIEILSCSIYYFFRIIFKFLRIQTRKAPNR